MYIVGHLEKVWRPLGERSVTVMTVVLDGPSSVRHSVLDVCLYTLGKKIETLRTRVSDNHDSCAGWTVVIMTVHHRCLSWGT